MILHSLLQLFTACLFFFLNQEEWSKQHIMFRGQSTFSCLFAVWAGGNSKLGPPTSIRPAATWAAHCPPRRSVPDQARPFLVQGTGQPSPMWEHVSKNLPVKINAAFSPKARGGERAWRQRKSLTWGFFSTCKHHEQAGTATSTQAKTPGAKVPSQHRLDDLKGLFLTQWSWFLTEGIN